MNNEKCRVLVFPAGTEVSIEICEALKYRRDVELYGATSIPCHAEFLFKNCINNIPFVNEQSFIERINDIVDKYDIDYIYPGHDSVLFRLLQNEKSVHAKIVSSPFETIKICNSKQETYNFLQPAEYIPKIYLKDSEVKEYPVFAKPKIGTGGIGTKIIENKNELTNYINDENYLITEYLPGDEYTVDCFTDKNGRLLIAKERHRSRIRSGLAVRIDFPEKNEYIQSIAQDINKKLKFTGAWYFQVKKSKNGQFKLMEVAARIAGSMCATRNQGINFPLLTLYLMDNQDVSVIDNNFNMIVDRTFNRCFRLGIDYEFVYIDFDDTILVHSKINLQAIQFLYQCLNNGKKVILLTRSNSNIKETLKKYKIDEGIFKEIIHIGEKDSKADYIKYLNSIFIDDSFVDRKRIKDTYGIPVFDVDMIESLLDYRG